MAGNPSVYSVTQKQDRICLLQERAGPSKLRGDHRAARRDVEVREPGQGVQRDHRRRVEAGRGFRQGPDYRPSTVPNRELDETATTNGGSPPNGW
jgi:hypothetical protein